jgi:hypothetical protein
MKSRLSLTVEVAVLATMLVAADAVTGSNVRWTECGASRAHGPRSSTCRVVYSFLTALLPLQAATARSCA